MNKKVLLGLAGTGLFAIAFLLGKVTTAKADGEDLPKARTVGSLNSRNANSYDLVALTDPRTGATCYTLGPDKNQLSCVH